MATETELKKPTAEPQSGSENTQTPAKVFTDTEINTIATTAMRVKNAIETFNREKLKEAQATQLRLDKNTLHTLVSQLAAAKQEKQIPELTKKMQEIIAKIDELEKNKAGEIKAQQKSEKSKRQTFF